MQHGITGLNTVGLEESVFKADPQRKEKYVEALAYWPGKFSEHALIADLLARGQHKRIIDSGGTGSFEMFLSNSSLTLANPAVNGIDGCALPFQDDTFDAGISTHTLEHVAPERREVFVTELVRVACEEVYMIFPIGQANIEIDEAKTRFVGNTHQHDVCPRITISWLKTLFEKHDWCVTTRGILNRAVHFMLAMLLPVDSDRKREICQWINNRYDVTPPLGEPYNILVHIRKKQS